MVFSVFDLNNDVYIGPGFQHIYEEFAFFLTSFSIISAHLANRVWLYTDKVTGQATGEATITYTSASDQVGL